MADKDSGVQTVKGDAPQVSLDQEAQILDDLTVLSREEADDSSEIDDTFTAPERTDGSGNENIQTDSRQNDSTVATVSVEGKKTEETIEIASQEETSEVSIPELNTDSEGGQDPVPPVEQPLPAAEVIFDP